MTITGIEQGRAAYAFETVKNYVEKNPGKSSDYRSYVKKMPSMIQVNGLGQTLAFYFSKGGVYRDIYDQVGAWIAYKRPELFGKGDVASSFVEMVIRQSNREYRLVTMEVLSLLNWMRRFAEGMVKAEQQQTKADGA